MTNDAARRAGWILAALVLLTSAVVFVRELPGASKPIPRDFAQYLVAARILLAQEPDALYFTDALTGITTPSFPGSRYQQIAEEAGLDETSYFIYPPWVGALFAPLTLTTPYRAYLAMYVLNWILAAAAVWVLARALPGGGGLAGWANFLLLIQSFLFVHALAAGQASVLVLFLMVLMARALWRGQDGRAGLWWALLTGLKLFPILYLPYAVALRKWRLLGAFAVWGLLLLAASVLVSDVAAHVRFLDVVRDYGGYTTARATNFSLTALLVRITEGGSLDAWGLTPIPAAVAWVSRVVFALVLAVALRASWIAERRADRWGRILSFGLMTTWVLCAGANVWSHQLVALALPLQAAAACLLVARAPGRLLPALWALAWGGLLSFQIYVRAGGAGEGSPFWTGVTALPLLGTLLLMLLLALMIERGPSACEEAPVER